MKRGAQLQSRISLPAAMSARAPVLQRKCGCGNHTSGGQCERCARHAPAIVHEVLASPGRPLDSGTRGFFEARFGRDFGGVRVHTDAAAAESARRVNALAYTVGRNVVFGEGQYSPATASGGRLLAHELTHVLQQRNTASAVPLQTQLAIGGSDDPGEREADRIATSVMSQQTPGGTSAPSVSASATLQRTCADGRCDDCFGGRRDFWVTAFFRRRATRRTMDNLRRQINEAKTILGNCCLDLKFDFNWTLLRGPAVFPAPTARPAGDPLGSLDYPADAEALGEGPTFSGARGVPMLVVDDVPGSGGGVTMLPGLDAEYTGRNYFAIAVNQTGPNPNCNHIAHELWHMTGATRHDAAEGPITACASNVVSLTYCTALRNMVAPRGDFPTPSRSPGATRVA